MSDRDDLKQPVDPTLDALLRRALGRGGLTPSQRGRHLDELGLEVEEVELLGGGEPVTGSPRTISFDVTTAPRETRSWRELLEMAAVVAVILLAGGLLLSQLWGGSDESGGPVDPAARVFATRELSTPTPSIAPPAPTLALPLIVETERLYVLGRVLTQAGDVVMSSSRATAIDPKTGAQEWSLYLGYRSDVLLSHDGETLFAASALPDGTRSELIAVDALTGIARWRVMVPPRVWWENDDGSPGMALTRDGRRLYVLSCSPQPASACDPSGAVWLTIHDTANGETIDELEVAGCLGAPFLSPDSGTIYLVCHHGGVRIVDLASGEAEIVPSGRPVVGATVSPGGRWLYVVHEEDGLYSATAYNMDSRKAVAVSVAHVGEQPERYLNLLAVSPDGSRLFLGIQRPGAGGSPAAGDIFVQDARTLQNAGRIAADPTITAASLAAGADNASVFAAHSVVERDPLFARTTITRFTLGDAPQTVAVLEHQVALRLISWTPRQMPPSRDGASREPDATHATAAG